MTIRYRCPVSTCTWFHEYVATNSQPERPTEIVLWTALNWASIAEWASRCFTVAQVIDAHLSTHSPVEWLAEIRRERERAETAEAALAQALRIVGNAADFTAAMDALTTMRMPSREQVEASKTALLEMAGDMANGACDG